MRATEPSRRTVAQSSCAPSRSPSTDSSPQGRAVEGRWQVFDQVYPLGGGNPAKTTSAVMAVPGVVLLIPKFLVLKQLGLYDQYSGMIIPLPIDAAGIFIMKQFFDSVPVAIEEAARIDGAGVFRTFWSVVLPMARPALITLTILSFQGSWNEFTHFLIATESESKQTLILALARLTSGQLGSGTQFPLKLAAALLATIPVALVFFAFQRHFVRGSNEGGVKG